MRFVIVLLLSALVGCTRTEAEPAATPVRSAPSSPAKTRAAAPTSSIEAPAAERIVAIGDLHGDLDATRRALSLAGAIDAEDRWIGGSLVVVQTGDAIDRGDQDREVLDLLERLAGEAAEAGGALHALSGNHEVMNVIQDFRYVSPQSVPAFATVGGRARAFMPGGPYATMLARRPILKKVGDSLFVHGGVLPKHVTYGLERMNEELSAFMRGTRPAPPAVVVAEDGPVWTRTYSLDPGPLECAQLGEVLSTLGAKRMVVGHTVQSRGITSACDERVFRIDVGMARFYGGPVQVLEIRGDLVRPLAESAGRAQGL